jgi:hypothetical protein
MLHLRRASFYRGVSIIEWGIRQTIYLNKLFILFLRLDWYVGEFSKDKRQDWTQLKADILRLNKESRNDVRPCGSITYKVTIRKSLVDSSMSPSCAALALRINMMLGKSMHR